MKPQDIIFFAIALGIAIRRKPRLLLYTGYSFLLLSIPFFIAQQALFTGQRLIMYASAFFLIYALWELYALRNTSHR